MLNRVIKGFPSYTQRTFAWAEYTAAATTLQKRSPPAWQAKENHSSRTMDITPHHWGARSRYPSDDHLSILAVKKYTILLTISPDESKPH